MRQHRDQADQDVLLHHRGTAYVTFDNVKVPKKYLIGEDGMGIYYILSNFNHERWVMCCSTIRAARAVCEECMLWIHQRKVFGKPLTSQPSSVRRWRR